MAISKYLKQNGIRPRGCKYTLNDKFFDRVDSENKAYILGFLYADGFVSKTTTCLSVTIQARDISVLEHINKSLASDRPIATKGNYRSFSIVNKQLHKSLVLLGCVPQKTFDIRLPKISDGLMLHFLRGYFDGDGYLNIRKKRKASGICAFCSNYKFCEDVRSFLSNHGISSRVYRRNTRNPLCAEVRVGRFTDIEHLYHLMYDDASFFMERKERKFRELFRRKYDHL